MIIEQYVDQTPSHEIQFLYHKYPDSIGQMVQHLDWIQMKEKACMIHCHTQEQFANTGLPAYHEIGDEEHWGYLQIVWLPGYFESSNAWQQKPALRDHFIY